MWWMSIALDGLKIELAVMNVAYCTAATACLLIGSQYVLRSLNSFYYLPLCLCPIHGYPRDLFIRPRSCTR